MHCSTQNTSRAEELAEKKAQERNSLNLSRTKILERIASDELRDKTFNMFRAVRGKILNPALHACKYPRRGQPKMAQPTTNGQIPKHGTRKQKCSAK
jgi:hypothetical protein